MPSQREVATSDQGCLSVVMPCFNEEATVATVIKRVLESPYTGELIVVDDGSTDGTVEIVSSIDDPRVRLFRQPRNRGKGAAIRRGFSLVSLPYVIIQDADLEYDPDDWHQVLAPLLRDEADVVYGSRFAGTGARRVLYFWHSVGNRALTLASNMMTNLNLTDMETCYKAFRLEVVRSLVIEEDRFGMEPEITAKVAVAGWRVFEVGITYQGRTYEEGKKIGWKDGMRAAYCIFVRYAPWWSGLRRRAKRAAEVELDVSHDELLSTLDSLDDADNYADWVYEMVEPVLGSTVVEVGAGHGTFTRRLSKGRRVLAVEPANSAVDRLEQTVAGLDGAELLHGDLASVPESIAADSVLFVNVLEHIDDDLGALRDARARLVPGGHVVVYAPALEPLYSRFDRAVGHVRRYRKKELAAVMDQAGLEVTTCRYVNAPGTVAWLLYAKLAGRTPTKRGPAMAYDRVVVPVIRRLEQNWEPPVGQSILCIGRRPE